MALIENRWTNITVFQMIGVFNVAFLIISCRYESLSIYGSDYERSNIIWMKSSYNVLLWFCLCRVYWYILVAYNTTIFPLQLPCCYIFISVSFVSMSIQHYQLTFWKTIELSPCRREWRTTSLASPPPAPNGLLCLPIANIEGRKEDRDAPRRCQAKALQRRQGRGSDISSHVPFQLGIHHFTPYS